MALSTNAITRLLVAASSENYGNEIANAINTGAAAGAQGLVCIPAAIVAVHTSTTTDFGVLAVGDFVIHIPASAGNAIFYTVATIGTLPASAVVGDLYVVLRAFAAPATVAATF